MTDEIDEAWADFASVRPRLLGIAYRMLGSVEEAEDVVQDTWIRRQGCDRSGVRSPAAFLTTTTTRLAINVAKSARARHETYVGPWLPEPVDTGADPQLGAERGAVLEFAVVTATASTDGIEQLLWMMNPAKLAGVAPATDSTRR